MNYAHRPTGRFEQNTQPQAGGDGGTSVLNLDEIVRILMRRFWLIAACVVVAVGIAGAILASTTPRYSTSAQIMLGQQGRADPNISDLVSGLSVDNKVIEGEIAILRSGKLLARVVDRLDLTSDAELNPALAKPSATSVAIRSVKRFIKGLFTKPSAPSAPQSEAMAAAASAEADILGENAAVIGALRGRMSARQLGGAYVVNVGFTSTDRRKAAAIANTIVDQYIVDQLEARFEQTRLTTEWLSGRLEDLKLRLEESERAAQEFRAQIGSVEGADGSDRLDQQISELTSNLIDARALFAEESARYAQIMRIVDEQGAIEASDALSSDIIDTYRRQLGNLRQSEAQTIARSGPDSPRLAPVRLSIQSIGAEIEREVNRLIDERRNAVDLAEARVNSLAKSLRELEVASIAQSRELVQYNQLEREADANRLIYESFLARFKESREVANLQRADARVISYASVPGGPSSPKVTVTLALAIMGGGAVGVGIAFLLAFFNNAFITPEQITQKLGVPVLASFSRIRLGWSKRNPVDFAQAKPHSTFAEEARSLRSQLLLGRGGEASQVVTVTSCLPSEGKTSTSLLLAWANSQIDRSCVIVDCDIRRPALTRYYEEDGGEDIVSVLKGEATLDDALRYNETHGVHVLPAIRATRDPSGLFTSRNAEKMVKELRERFELVIFDTAPIFALSDAMALAKQSDMVLFAVRWKSTPVAAVERCMKSLRDIDVHNIGAVMTLINRREEAYYQFRGYTKSYAKYSKAYVE